MEGKKKTNGQGKEKISRRNFLGGAAAATMGFTVVPRYVLGGAGFVPPSEKVNIAVIGVGGMGGVDLEIMIGEVEEVTKDNIVAICDVDAKYAAKNLKKYPKAKVYRDFRKMLEKEKAIDAVLIATPDHNHAHISIAAMRMGKHVYCEKPLTHTIYEADMMAKVARETGVATQMGNTGQAEEKHVLETEWIADGAIGTVKEVHVWCARPGSIYGWPAAIGRPKDTPPVPEGLDWDMWLGPAPYRPYHRAYMPFSWRGWRDFGTGALGDIGCHRIFHPFRTLNLGHPTSVEVYSTKPNRIIRPEGTRALYQFEESAYEDASETYPMACIAYYKFPARGDRGPITLIWYDGGMKPRRPDELEEGRELSADAMMYVGDKGKMLDGRIIPESKMREYKRPPKTLPRSPGHYTEWINACKGGPTAGANFEVASLVTKTVLLGNVAQRVGKRLYWDGPNMKVTNVPEANEYIHKEYRKGWTL